MMSKFCGRLLMIIGLLLMAAALSLTIFNIWDEQRAEDTAEELLQKWEEEKLIGHGTNTDAGAAVIPDYILDPNMAMPTKMIEGVDCIGTLQIPAMSAELPVISNWSYPNLRIAPCLYQGSVYLDNMIIAAHNYDRHFGQIKTLQQGDQVIFTDAADNLFYYSVAEMEVLQSTAVKEMSAGNWDLTLFTCTIGGQTRVTVRCLREETEGR